MRLVLAGLLLCAMSAVAQGPITLKLPCEFRAQQISPTGKHVAVRCTDKSVRLLEVPSGKEIASFPAKYRYDNFDFAPDGKWFGVAGEAGLVEVVSVASPEKRVQWNAGGKSFDLFKFVSSSVIVLALNAGPGEIWDISSKPTKKAILETDFDGLTSAAASPDGGWVVTTGADTVVRFYRAPDWKLAGEYRGYLLEPFASAFTADGKHVVIGGADCQLTMFDPATAKPVKTLPVQNDPFERIESLDANQVIALSFDADGKKPPHLDVWNLETGSSKPVSTDEAVTGGAVVEKRIWLARGSSKTLALSVGQ
jgi:WD40 repeat protein